MQLRQWSWEGFIYGVPVGLLAVAVLLANNTRDIELDKKGNPSLHHYYFLHLLVFFFFFPEFFDFFRFFRIFRSAIND